jgi:hypothetical protein
MKRVQYIYVKCVCGEVQFDFGFSPGPLWRLFLGIGKYGCPNESADATFAIGSAARGIFPSSAQPKRN